MNHFGYKQGILSAEDVSLTTLAERVGTPFYCYSRATLERHYKVFAGAHSERGYDPLDPHEGYLADFLYRKKAVLLS